MVPKTAKMFPILCFVLFSISNIFCNKKEATPTLPYYNDASFEPYFINESEALNKINHRIADFNLLNQDSIVINKHFIHQKIHVANFIFTTCGSICPSMTKNLKIVSDSLKNDTNIVFLSYTVTPWIDVPHKLKEYRELYDIKDTRWQFLTGNKNDIYTLARKSYFAEEEIGFNKDSSEFLHTEHFILVDKKQRIRGIYNGTLELEMYQLIEDIKSLETD